MLIQRKKNIDNYILSFEIHFIDLLMYANNCNEFNLLCKDNAFCFSIQNFYQNSKQYHTCALVVVIERPFVRMATPNPDITPLAVFLITRDVSGYILAKTPTKQQLYSLADISLSFVSSFI